MHIYRYTLPVIFLLFFKSALAVDSGDPLKAFLKDFKSMQANFVQTLINEDGEQLEKTSGTLYLQQPGKFHWSYQEPYSQKIISDGDNLWIYDEDLEQVTIKPMGDTIDQTPAGIILGNSDINIHFVTIDMGKIEGYDWIELTPRDLEAQYKNIRFGFDKNRLGMMIIADNLGQVTRIDFEGINKNSKLPTELFKLEIPENVDVIDEREQQ